MKGFVEEYDLTSLNKNVLVSRYSRNTALVGGFYHSGWWTIKIQVILCLMVNAATHWLGAPLMRVRIISNSVWHHLDLCTRATWALVKQECLATTTSRFLRLEEAWVQICSIHWHSTFLTGRLVFSNRSFQFVCSSYASKVQWVAAETGEHIALV